MADSASSGITTKPIKGWGRLGEWLNGLLDDLKATEVMPGIGTAISQTDSGRSVDVNAGPAAGDGGGGGEVETVTGAVNGVPSTLNVLTDGTGWIAI